MSYYTMGRLIGVAVKLLVLVRVFTYAPPTHQPETPIEHTDSISSLSPIWPGVEAHADSMLFPDWMFGVSGQRGWRAPPGDTITLRVEWYFDLGDQPRMQSRVFIPHHP